MCDHPEALLENKVLKHSHCIPTAVVKGFFVVFVGDFFLGV